MSRKWYEERKVNSDEERRGNTIYCPLSIYYKFMYNSISSRTR